ncbi:MAG: glycosyltransferase, partial [Bacillus sp. (in: firmicutes)]|nr:glycosyltransferase [Bacillus sp. (in: firmicutes)]
MKPKVSIIVPIYNIERYLSRCLNSLLTQTLPEIEVIAVNDGSTDSSVTILEQYAEKDDRIKIINKSNGGVSSARNVGMSLASGEYIGFVDPDDWVETDMYKTMYNSAIAEKVDIVMCSYLREFGNHSKEKNFNLPEKVIYNNEEVKTKLMRRLIGPLENEVANPELLDAWGTVWSKIYKTDLLKNNELSFIDLKEIGTNEDSLFNIEAFYYSNSFVFINKPFYHYWRENSSSLTSNYKPELLSQWFSLYKRITNFLNEKNLPQEYKLALNNRICLNTMGLGLNTISKNNKSNQYEKIKKIDTILNNEKIKKSFRHFDLSHFPMIWKVFFSFAKYRFS